MTEYTEIPILKKIKAPKWLIKAVNTYNDYNKKRLKIAAKINEYLERADYSTENLYDNDLQIKIVHGKVEEISGKEYLKVENQAMAGGRTVTVFFVIKSKAIAKTVTAVSFISRVAMINTYNLIIQFNRRANNAKNNIINIDCRRYS